MSSSISNDLSHSPHQIELTEQGAPVSTGAQLFEGVIYVVLEAHDEDNANFQLQQLINNNQDLQDHLAEGQIEGEVEYE